jgi:ABC-type sugar transport system ATPase subunit
VNAAAAAPLLRLRGITKGYPGVLALRGADLDIEAGSVLGLLGKNGAGKSTLINVLAGAVRPDSGEVRLDGEVVEIENSHRSTALGLAFMHQELEDVPNLTVAENVHLGLGFPRRAGLIIDRRRMARQTKEVLARLESDIDPRAELASLSIVDRRLVMIARALAAEARAIFLDEPTASLTDDDVEHLHKVVRRVRDDGVAVVYVSHRLEEIIAITDRVAIMCDGATVATGPTAAMTKAQMVEHITGSAAPVEQRHPRPVKIGERILEVKGLSRPGAVANVDLTLRRGEILGIAGLVGAGRSELARLIAGADRPSAGEIWVAGKPVTPRSPRSALAAGIALLPEDRRNEGAVLDFSLRKNVTLPTLSRHRIATGVPIPRRRSERRAAERSREGLGIKIADVDQPVRHLSGGNQQKAIVAKWLEKNADILIFDEPTLGVDVDGKSEIYDLLEKLAGEGKGVIFISSEFTELVGVCSRIVVMREGSLTAELTREDINAPRLVQLCYGH